MSGRADPQARATIEAHIDRCSTCRHWLVELASLAQAPAAATIPPPEQVGRYALVREVGRGAMGTVYEAEDPVLERRVAVKLLHPERSTSHAMALREARALAQVEHPNVVGVHHVGTEHGRVYIVMELVVGTNARTWLTAHRRSPTEVMRVFEAVARGLAAVHAEGLVHRDFKPDNVLVADDGRVLVSDFGLAGGSARVWTEETLEPFGVESIATGALVGTPAYMAPEQLRGESADAKSDQFAFCVALWEALYGVRPFAGRTVLDLLDSISRGEIVPPSREVAVPRRLELALRRGLAAEPSQRHRDMTVLVALLGQHEPRPRTRMAVGLAAIGGLALVFAAATPRAVEPVGPAPATAAHDLSREATVKTADAWLLRAEIVGPHAMLRELERMPSERAELQTAIAFVQGEMHVELRQYDTAKELLSRAYVHANDANHEQLKTRIALSLASVHTACHEPEAAQRWLREAEAVASSLRDVAEVAFVRGIVDLSHKNVDTARASIEEAVGLLADEPIPARLHESMIRALAVLADVEGDSPTALALSERMLAAKQSRLPFEAWSLTVIEASHAQRLLGSVPVEPAGFALLDQAEARLNASEDPSSVNLESIHMARASGYTSIDRPEAAIEALQRCVDHSRVSLACRARLGGALYLAHRYEDAIAELSRWVDDFARAEGEDAFLAPQLIQLADARSRVGQYDQAERDVRRARDIAIAHDRTHVQQSAELVLARIQAQR